MMAFDDARLFGQCSVHVNGVFWRLVGSWRCKLVAVRSYCGSALPVLMAPLEIDWRHKLLIPISARRGRSVSMLFSSRELIVIPYSSTLIHYYNTAFPASFSILFLRPCAVHSYLNRARAASSKPTSIRVSESFTLFGCLRPPRIDLPARPHLLTPHFEANPS